MFTWKPIYAEIASKLLEFQFNNAALVELLIEMHREGLKALPYMDKDDEGAEFPLEEIDPFTFFANFNRGITDSNRQAILQFLKSKWELQSDVPADFSGLPLVNLQKSWLMSFKARRASDHVAKLWSLFAHVSSIKKAEELDTELFDSCLALRNVGLATMTMGMFWVKPDLWISLDDKNIEFAKSLDVPEKPRDGLAYIQWLKTVREKTDIPIYEFSHQAHVRVVERRGESNSEIATPYSRLFDDFEQADIVLDMFADVLETLGSDSDDSVTVVSFTKKGKSGGQLRVVYGRWAVFGYRRLTSRTEYQVLIAEDNELASEVETAYRFESKKSDKAFVLGWVTEAWLTENQRAVQYAMQESLAVAKQLFSHYSASPYGPSHSPDWFALIISKKERRSVLTTPSDDEFESYVNYWLLAPGEGGFLWEEYLKRQIGTIGWDELGDLSDYKDKDEIASAVAELYPDNGAKSVAAMMWYFVDEMKAGDIVFAKHGMFKVYGWGIITGDYKHEPDRQLHKSTLPIDWKSQVEVNVPEGMQLAMKTLTPMTGKDEFLDAMADLYPGIEELQQSESANPIEPIVNQPKRYTKADAMADLFMPEEKLDLILKQLKRKKNLVLQGAPGTGKTFVARRIAYLLMEQKDPERAPMVQFHQSTSYEDFIQGYRPDGSGGFELKNGGFFEFCELARSQPDRQFVYIIDEINRGNLSKIFGELLMLVEHDKRKKEFAVPLTYAKSQRETFYIPANVYLIGTMNTADRSLSMVDYALRRRFSFVELEPGFSAAAFSKYLQTSGASSSLVSSIQDRMSSLNNMIAKDTISLGRGFRIGHSYFVPAVGHQANEEWLNEIIECEVVPLLEEYWCDDESQLEKACRIARGIA